MKAVLRAAGLLIVVGLIAASVAAYSIASKGLSTRVQPSAVETRMALVMRDLATPTSVRSQSSPVASSDGVFAEGLEHFADHCATCHGNDGIGDTEIGRSLYPPAPDMRMARTQDLTDGELFSIIENGIRLTGMPAWGTGTPDGERSSWVLVQFIRALPNLTADQIEQMEALNPKSAEEFRKEEAVRRFLEGGETAESPSAHTRHE